TAVHLSFLGEPEHDDDMAVAERSTTGSPTSGAAREQTPVRSVAQDVQAIARNCPTISFSENSLPDGHTISALGGALMALMAALLAAPGGALAHAKLTSSTPADGSTVAPGITTINMTFSEAVSVTQSTAQLLQADGTAIAGASSAVDRADRTKMTITTPA